MNEVILEATDVCKYYPVQSSGFGARKGIVRAVDGVSLAVKAGEVFGLVGESGCGKSSLGRSLLRLEDPTSGKVEFEGGNLCALKGVELKQFRRQAQVIYQDPYSALNPRQKVCNIIGEPLIIHGIGDKKEREKRVQFLMEVVGLRPGQARRYPHEFSGGQRQRIVIARALALQPKFILADEPVSALDVSIQAQVINLMQELRAQFGLTYIFISHDLSVVEYICDRVAVMYLGRLVELADKETFYSSAQHPYSQALLSAAPTPIPGAKVKRIMLQGDVPSPINPPAGCPFHPRCLEATEVCREARPDFREISLDHRVACHHR
ncbi:ABC transporter ATP-binding protein [Desulfopila sp. IMCC35008]|uniref:ABC transporter ATP-binding protein n=1 Tax=Desulfopila sp. IMCC35008 TaxID=2653858 RepID=UPI0013D42594|nr:dipeptide ABC transporter ATP-binding protein [Desulfopila sp. IMCC35008]